MSRWCGSFQVSTHSRPKAAADTIIRTTPAIIVSTHSRPKAAATKRVNGGTIGLVSTHSRPKAAAAMWRGGRFARYVSTHSRPKAAAIATPAFCWQIKFQHTAARRRLPNRRARTATCDESFNTQPPEGGCRINQATLRANLTFQHTAARRRLQVLDMMRIIRRVFQHTAARRRLRGGKRGFRRFYGFNTQPPEGGCSLYEKMIKISRLLTVFRYPLKHKEWEGV